MSVIHLNSSNFKETVEKTGTVLVDFSAVWCGPCQMMAPVLESISNSHKDIVVGKVDVDESESLAMKYRTSSIPTLILFKDGLEVNRVVGFMEENELVKRLGL